MAETKETPFNDLMQLRKLPRIGDESISVPNREGINALIPLFHKHQINVDPILDYAERPTSDSYGRALQAVSELTEYVEWVSWRRWASEWPETPARGVEGGKMNPFVVQFRSFEVGFRDLLCDVPLEADLNPDTRGDTFEEWHERAGKYSDKVGLVLLEATNALNPPFWDQRSLTVQWLDPWLEEPAVESHLAPRAYWLLFVLDLLEREEASKPVPFPLDELNYDFLVSAGERAMEDDAEAILHPATGHHFVFCAGSMFACRVFRSWCAGFGVPSAAPVIDEATFSVRWWENSCELGNTQQFRLIQELARAPNQFLSSSMLAERIGGSQDDKIAHVKSRLVKALEEAGMSSLASRIRSEPGHYGLFLS